MKKKTGMQSSSQASAGRTTSFVGASTAIGGHRVLIVDDDACIRSFCRTVLEPIGLRCVEASDGELGLEAAAQQDFDLILLDIDMPKMQGPDVLRHLRKEP